MPLLEANGDALDIPEVLEQISIVRQEICLVSVAQLAKLTLGKNRLRRARGRNASDFPTKSFGTQS
jgi:hypothetical protein